MDSQKLVELLRLELHPEGGYFRRTYCSNVNISITTDSDMPSENASNGGVQRSIMSSIYYLLTSDKPTMWMHWNRSDIVHYFHTGSPVQFIIISPSGKLIQETLGADILSGERPQLLVAGGFWKSATLKNRDGFSLTSEAVAPGFDYTDNKLATGDEMKSSFPQHWEIVKKYIKQCN